MSTPRPNAASVSQHAPYGGRFQNLCDHCFFSFRSARRWVTQPDTVMTKMVMGIKASSTGTSMACKSAHRSITPAAAGTNSSGKMPVRNSAAVRTCSRFDHPKAQRRQQQHQPVHAGRDGQRQHQVANLPRKAERRNAGKFKYQFHLCFPLLSGSAPTTALRKTRHLIVIFFAFPGCTDSPVLIFSCFTSIADSPTGGKVNFRHV